MRKSAKTNVGRTYQFLKALNVTPRTPIVPAPFNRDNAVVFAVAKSSFIAAIKAAGWKKHGRDEFSGKNVRISAFVHKAIFNGMIEVSQRVENKHIAWVKLIQLYTNPSIAAPVPKKKTKAQLQAGDSVKFVGIGGDWVRGVLKSGLTVNEYGMKGYYINEDGDNFKSTKLQPGRYFVYRDGVKVI